MNYLAHLFLSSGNPDEMVGNFIGDYVKGTKFISEYPHEMAVGVYLHRAIDAFTDTHVLHKDARTLLQPLYGKFSGVIADMLYDHFLAKTFESYSKQPLARFEKECYRILFAYMDVLPERVQSVLPKMRRASRLQSYARLEGLFESLDIMSNYSSLPHKTTELAILMPKITLQVENDFTIFFKELMEQMPQLREQSEQRLLR